MDHKISKDMISSGMIPSGEKTQADLGRTQYGSAPSPSSLADAYKSIYEHHQKDKDGNTIPHEGEELNEVAPLLAAPLIAKGLMAAKTAAAVAAKSKMGAAALKGAAAFKKGLMTAKSASAAGKITTSGGKLAAGAKKVGMAQKAGQYTRSGLAAMKNNPTMTALTGMQVAPMLGGGPKMPTMPAQQRAASAGRRTAGGLRMDLDLFDVVKGKLLDEGLTEEECTEIMTTLTLDEIQEGLGQITLGQIAGGAAKAAMVGGGAALAYQGAKKLKKMGDDALNKARDQKGGNKRVDDVRKGSGDNTVGTKLYN